MSLKTVETNITTRWEKGIDHNPQSEEIVRSIADIDFEYGGDFFCFKIGGDGDNGEHLMYLLDIYFDQREEDQKKRQAEFYKEQQEKCRRLTRDLN